MSPERGKGRSAQANERAQREYMESQAAKQRAEETEKAKAEADEKAVEANRKRTQHLITIATAIVSLSALGVSLWQGYEAKKGVDAQVKATSLQYRPWLELKDFQPPHLDGSADDTMTFVITNVGPLPAQGNWYTVLKSVAVQGHHTWAPGYGELWGNTDMTDTTNYPFVVSANQSVNLTRYFRNDGDGLSPNDRAGIANGNAMPITCIRIDFRGPEAGDNEPRHVYRACMFRDPATHVWGSFVTDYPANERY